MPRIFDNIDQKLLPALKETLDVAYRADFCVGYFNLRGWRQLDESIQEWTGGENYQCRLLVGMQRRPQDELKTIFSFREDGSRIDNKRAIQLKKELANEFRQQQTELGGEVDPETKSTLRRRLAELEEELNRALALQYGIDPAKPKSYEKWRSSHQPFHWFIEFYGILQQGGFDVIIGNPPYVEMHKIRGYKLLNYETQDCGNIYAPCVERFSELLSSAGMLGVIVPLSGFSTARMESYQEYLKRRYKQLYLSYFSGDAHPSVMFNGVKYRLCIITAMSIKNQLHKVNVTDYIRWYSDERLMLFPAKIYYQNCRYEVGYLRFAKVSSPILFQVIDKMLNKNRRISTYLTAIGSGHINYHRSPVFWIRSMNFEPYFKSPTRTRSLDHLKDLYFVNQQQANRVAAILNSTCFYIWFTIQGNCRNITGTDIETFPIGDLTTSDIDALEPILNRLMVDIQNNSRRRVYNYKTGPVEYDEFYLSKSKPIIDEIDRVLAQHYGFIDEELDFIINYDIKYRMGDELFEDGNEA